MLEMIISSQLCKGRGLLLLTRLLNVRRQSYKNWANDNVSDGACRTFGIHTEAKVLTVMRVSPLHRLSTRCIHYTASQAFKTICPIQKDQSNPYDFESDPEIKSWMKEISGDFDNEQTDVATDSGKESVSSTSDDIPAERSGSSSDSDDDLEESTNTVRSSEIEEIDYEEFFLEDEAVRHEDLIEDLPLPIELKRGEKGVFDTVEVVKVLEEENGEDICVIPVPPEINYTDNLIIVTGKSFRHLLGMAELIRWIYKQKRNAKDPPSVRIEGLQSGDWLALDLGNVVLHLMLNKVRKKYDLESLWLLGPDKDPLCQEFEHNPYILNSEAENTDGTQPNEQQSDASSSQQTDYYGMQSVAGWHEDVQNFPKPTNDTQVKKSTSPKDKES